MKTFCWSAMGAVFSRSCWLGALVIGIALPAFASLGGDASTVEADRAQMNALVKLNQTEKYTVHEIQVPNGTVVREFVSPAGRVFGVAWQGPSIPDFHQVLGTYFPQYLSAAKAARAARRGRAPINIQQPGLVVQNTGHMRAFAGRAYDPGLLPEGVSANDVR